MGHHHFLWVVTASPAQAPSSITSKDEQANRQASRIIEVGLVCMAALLTLMQPAPGDLPPTAMAQEILAAHNKYRVEIGTLPIQWSNTLASHALEWADHLAATQTFHHANEPLSKYHEGENLWMGSDRRYTYTQMIDAFGREKQYFFPGIYPDVKKPGAPMPVGHYTQMIWRKTRYVGCAGNSGVDGYYRLVCRYYPAGNVINQRVY
jgi:uncharacterized protein YkwD